MTAGTDPASLMWASVLCAGLALWAARARDDAGRRARRLIGGAAPQIPARPVRTVSWTDVTQWLGRRLKGRRPGRRRPVREAGAGVRPSGLLTSRFGRGPGTSWPWTRPTGPRWWPLPGVQPEVVCLPMGVALGVLTRSVVPVLAGLAALPLVGRMLRRRAERAAASRRADAVATLCGTVAADLRTGRPPHAALGDAVEAARWPASPEFGEAGRVLLSAARFGGDVPRALRESARLYAGAEGLAAVAACWQVAVDGGAGLAAALDRVAAALRAEADQREDLRAQLAGPRSTAVLLALLPVFGLVLGAGLGADPSKVLLHTPAGMACLTAGGLLEWAGLAWTSRIIRGAEGGPVRRTAAAGTAERRPS